MKLIIQIPCFNEERTLADTYADLPKAIPGFDDVEVLVIDDGSTDNTVQVASSLGVDHILQLDTNRGLATAFSRGLEFALAHGADVVVNTDGDNQYKAAYIPLLVHPILMQKADIVIGSRPILTHPEFGPIKKLLQLLGSWTIRQISKTDVRDAASGFRAFSREACLRLSIVSSFSYTMESIIQAGNSGLKVASVDIDINHKTRDSRLFKSKSEFIFRSGSTILSMFLVYRPLTFFSLLSALFLVPSFLLGIRFLYLVYFADSLTGRTYLPSLILLSIMTTVGVLLLVLGLIGLMIRSTSQIQAHILYQLKKINDDSFQ